MKIPSISVLMPVYNSEKYVAEAIESILNQTFQDFEFLIIDDGSTDKTGKIAKSYKDRRIKYFKNYSNLGVIKALNHGIRLSAGKYIARMDADDISLPNRLKIQYEYMENHRDIFVCGSLIKVFGDIKKYIWDTPGENEVIKARMIFESSLAHSSTILRTSLFKEYGFKYDRLYKHVEDYWLWVKVSEKFKLANISRVLLHYRVHKDQIGQRYTIVQHDNSLKIRRYLLYKLGLHPSYRELQIHQKLSNWEAAKDIKELIDMNKWIKKLLTVNLSRKYYSPKILLEVMGERWAGMCYLSDFLGLKKYLLMLSVPSFIPSITLNTLSNYAKRFFK